MDTHRVLSWLIVSYSAIAALVLSLSLSEWPTNWTALEIFYLPMLWLCVQQPQRGLWFAISVVVLLDIVLLVFVHDLALLQQGLIKTGLFMLMAGLVSSAVEYHRHRCNVLQRESALLQRQLVSTQRMVDQTVAVHQRIEQALYDAQAHLIALMDNTEDQIWVVDTCYRFLIGNRRFQERIRTILGRDIVVKESLLSDAFPPHLQIVWRSNYDRALLGEQFRIERVTELTTPPQEIEYLFSPIYAADTSVTGAIVIGRDITERKRIEKALQDSEQRFRQMFEDHNAIMLLVEPKEGRIVAANQAAARFYGYSQTELSTMTIQQINMLTPQEIAHERQKAVQNQCNVFTFPHRLANGAIRTVEVHSSPIITLDDQTLLFSIITDITARKQAEKALQESEERLRMAIQGAGVGLWDWNVEREQVICHGLMTLLGYSIEETELNLNTLNALIHADDLPQVQACLQAHLREEAPLFEAEYRLRRADNRWLWVLNRGRVMVRDERRNPLRVSGTIIDISTRKYLEQQLKQLSITDPLTGAYNRRYLQEALAQEVRRADRYGTPLSLIMFDIDHFKRINDSCGHDVGDEVLKGVVRRFRRRIRRADVLCRWGGEEFMILCAETPLPAAIQLAETLMQALHEHGIADAVLERVTASFGVAHYQAGESLNTLLKRVDDQVYEAKQAGRDCVRYAATG